MLSPAFLNSEKRCNRCLSGLKVHILAIKIKFESPIPFNPFHFSLNPSPPFPRLYLVSILGDYKKRLGVYPGTHPVLW